MSREQAQRGKDAVERDDDSRELDEADFIVVSSDTPIYTRQQMAAAWDEGVKKASSHGGAYLRWLLRWLLLDNPWRD